MPASSHYIINPGVVLTMARKQNHQNHREIGPFFVWKSALDLSLYYSMVWPSDQSKQSLSIIKNIYIPWLTPPGPFSEGSSCQVGSQNAGRARGPWQALFISFGYHFLQREFKTGVCTLWTSLDNAQPILLYTEGCCVVWIHTHSTHGWEFVHQLYICVRPTVV